MSRVWALILWPSSHWLLSMFCLLMIVILFSIIPPWISYFEHGHFVLARIIENLRIGQDLNSLSFGCLLVSLNLHWVSNLDVCLCIKLNASSSSQLESSVKGGLVNSIDLSPLKCWQAWTGWQEGGCQPNFWRNVYPDSTSYCGPYKVSALSRKGIDSDSDRDGLSKELHKSSSARSIGYGNHDTISMAVIDKVRLFNPLKFYLRKEFV